MKKITLALSTFAVILSACQKEPSFEDPSGTGGGGTTNTSNLLTRTVETDGTDSTEVAYGYSGDKLSRLDITGNSASPLTYKILRNASGSISQTVLLGPDLVTAGIDSLVTNYSYNAGNGHYTYSRYTLTLSGITYSDSTAFTYDASGNISSATAYEKVLLLPYTPYSRTDYTYSNGNVANEKYYDYDPSTSKYSLSETSAYTYDAKVNPLKLGAEAILLGIVTSLGPNNSTGFSYTDATDPSNNYTRTSTFSYNSSNKPSGGTAVENPGAVNYTLRFFYN